MSKIEISKKEIIEKALLSSMKNIDEALVQIATLKTDADSYNYSKLTAVKHQIKTTLNRNYDHLARQQHIGNSQPNNA